MLNRTIGILTFHRHLFSDRGQYLCVYGVIVFVMKIKFLKLKNWLLMALMGAIGASGCKSNSKIAVTEEPPAPRPTPREEIRLMYGVPTMNYMIRGQVHDDDGQPLGDIRINMLELNMAITGDSLHGDPERVSEYLESTFVATDKNGRFSIESSGRPQESVRLLVRDVDGENNGGAFVNHVVDVEVTPEGLDRTNAGGWNQGTFNKELDITLERK